MSPTDAARRRGLTLAEYHELQAKTWSEAQLQSKVLIRARFHGWRWYHTRDSRKSPSGYPDLTLIHPRRRRQAWAELKSEKGPYRDEQPEWLTDLADSGAEVYVWRPSDYLSGAVDLALATPPTFPLPRPWES